MKLLLEILVSIFLHPVAVLLAWVNIAGRRDLSGLQKVVWFVVVFFPVGPILYVLVGGGGLW